MPYLEVCLSLHYKEACRIKKKNPTENKLMAQRKGNLHVNNRSSEERDKEDLDTVTAARWSVSRSPRGADGESAPEPS